MTAILDRRDSSDTPAGTGPADVAASPVGRLKAAALFTAVSDALNFVAAEPSVVAVLAGVRLEAFDGQLVAVATDRFVLGVSRVHYSGAAFSVTVSTQDARALARMAKTLKRDGWREATVEVDATAVSFRFSTGESMTVPGMDGDYPDWRHLIPPTDQRMGAVIGVAYDPVFLAKFAKVRTDERLRNMVVFPAMTDARLNATVVQVGEDFIGAVRPAHKDEQRYERPGWLASPAVVAARSATQAASDD